MHCCDSAQRQQTTDCCLIKRGKRGLRIGYWKFHLHREAVQIKQTMTTSRAGCAALPSHWWPQNLQLSLITKMGNPRSLIVTVFSSSKYFRTAFLHCLEEIYLLWIQWNTIHDWQAGNQSKTLFNVAKMIYQYSTSNTQCTSSTRLNDNLKTTWKRRHNNRFLDGPTERCTSSSNILEHNPQELPSAIQRNLGMAVEIEMNYSHMQGKTHISSRRIFPVF